MRSKSGASAYSGRRRGGDQDGKGEETAEAKPKPGLTRTGTLAAAYKAAVEKSCGPSTQSKEMATLGPAQKQEPLRPRSPLAGIRQPLPTRTERQPSWSLPPEALGTEQRQRQERVFEQATGTIASPQSQSRSQSQERAASPVKTRPLPSASPSPFAMRNAQAKYDARLKMEMDAPIDLNLDDAPPPALHRSASPSSSRSSTESVPIIRTPVDEHAFRGSQPAPASMAAVPRIALPGGDDYEDDNTGSGRGSGAGAPQFFVSPTPAQSTPTNRKAVPVVNLPGGDDFDDKRDDGNRFNSVPMVSVSGPSAPPSPAVPVSVILDDLASAATVPSISFGSAGAGSSPGQTRSRTLPQPPPASPTSSVMPSSSSSGIRNGRSRSGGLVCGGCHGSILGRIVSAMGARWHPQCFKCSTCGELLEHVSSYEHEGKAYCHLDYHEVRHSKNHLFSVVLI